MKTVMSKLVDRGNKTLRQIGNVAKSMRYYGNARICPVCNRSSSKFLPYGVTPRADAQCVHCGSLERHCLLWLFLNEKTNLFDGNPKAMLHVAPERCFEPRFKKQLGGGYLTADLSNPKAMVKMDIADIQYPDQ